MKKKFRFPILVFSILISLLVGVYQNCSGTKVSSLSESSSKQNSMIVENSELVAAEKIVWGGFTFTVPSSITPNKRYQIMRNGTSRLKTENLAYDETSGNGFYITSTVITNVLSVPNSTSLLPIVDAVSSTPALVREGAGGYACDAESVSYYLYNNQITSGKYEYLKKIDCEGIMVSPAYPNLNLGTLTQALDLL